VHVLDPVAHTQDLLDMSVSMEIEMTTGENLQSGNLSFEVRLRFGLRESFFVSPYLIFAISSWVVSRIRLSMLARACFLLLTVLRLTQPQYRSITNAHAAHTGPVASIPSAICSRPCTVTGQADIRNGFR
jgi:hypothetical protein